MIPTSDHFKIALIREYILPLSIFWNVKTLYGLIILSYMITTSDHVKATSIGLQCQIFCDHIGNLTSQYYKF